MDQQRYVIGVDGGTESLRAAVFDSTGHILGAHAAPYDTQFPQPGWAEQRPEDWWSALGEAVRGAVAASGVAQERVAAMCLDTTCCTVVALGPDGTPLRPALLWMDMRSAAQAARVAAAEDVALQVNSGGCGPVSAEWMIPKALWLAECEPHVYAAAATICEYQDYLNLRLTGRRCASANNMSVRWHYSTQRGPPLSLLAKLGIPDLATKWPSSPSTSTSSSTCSPSSSANGQGEVLSGAVLAPGELVGGLTPSAAEHLGLPAGTPVAQGGADAFIGMIGLGVVRPGQMALLTGSSHLQLGVVDSELHGRGFFGTYRDAVLPGCHIIEGGQTSTGSAIAWFRRTCCAPGTSYGDLDLEAAEVPPGCEGLLALDHFQGNRTPHTDALSRGALVGLTLKHGRGHVFRALLESVAAGSALILRTMSSAGYRPQSITLAGGVARSPLWLQIHADMCGLPLRLTRCGDAPMLGCAILAAVAVGMYDSVQSAAAAMVAVEREVTPDPAAVAAYQQTLARYAALYPALAPIFHGKEPATATLDPRAPLPFSAVPPPSSADPPNGTHPCGGGAANGAHRYGGAVLVAPSILAADFAALGSAVSAAEAAGAEWVHVDVFDGSWERCPNFTIGPPVVAALRRGTGLHLDCHLAVADPGRYVDALVAAGASGITFHYEVVLGGQQQQQQQQQQERGEQQQQQQQGQQERGEQQQQQQQGQQRGERGEGRGEVSGPGGSVAADVDVDVDVDVAVAALAARIRSAGLRAGVALAPDTPLTDELVSLAQRGEVDMVLVMTVPPGFGGQCFQSGALDKVRRLRGACPGLLIQVDGGVNASTAALAVAAGANVLVAGSFLYGHPKGLAVGVAELRAAAAGALRSTD
ncbi:hypothetical protein PLESTB_001153500 [Pleodorina starrii]|uniref:glycerol kinase n=1 Tax=Pleodorina starrii TaxID=330485 RepID=A0A9W6BRD6_9CHLO|nr:hypothetical protein PLESTM_001782400 [Pleodorina starrii]GLC56829.1 hypothetical protein PLESTB_001153500 [Pleodorina starrii]GLC68163.1 hypothetical protein PLESTF_000655200 [Pleodorina starrii]